MQRGMRGDEMRILYEWVRSMVSFLIFATMIMNLLPDKKYENYLHLYVGCLFLIIAVSPFAELGGVEEQAAEAFSRLTFANDAKLLQKGIEDADKKRMEDLEKQYVDAIELDIRTMTEGMDVFCKEVTVMIEHDIEDGSFGQVNQVRLVLTAADDAEIMSLKRRIQTYYGVEEGNITIHLQSE